MTKINTQTNRVSKPKPLISDSYPCQKLRYAHLKCRYTITAVLYNNNNKYIKNY